MMNPMMNYQGQGQGQQDQSGGAGQQGNPIQNPMMMNPMFFGHQMMMNQQMIHINSVRDFTQIIHKWSV